MDADFSPQFTPLPSFNTRSLKYEGTSQQFIDLVQCDPEASSVHRKPQTLDEAVNFGRLSVLHPPNSLQVTRQLVSRKEEHLMEVPSMCCSTKSLTERPLTLCHRCASRTANDHKRLPRCAIGQANPIREEDEHCIYQGKSLQNDLSYDLANSNSHTGL